jgi:transposase
MLSFPAALDVYVYTHATDMRKSYDSLASLVQNEIKQNPLSGHIFVFFNKSRNRVKLLYWDKSGYCIFMKRLEEGRFHIYDWNGGHTSYVTDPKELSHILDGIDLINAKKYHRYTLIS